MSSPENDGPPEEPARSETAGADEAAERAEPALVAEAEKPKTKKGKKKKKAPASSDAAEFPLRSERDAAGRDRPAFLLRFPEDPELEILSRAFEVGNYAKVRSDAPRLIERSESAPVKAAAEELLRRIEPDPLMKVLLAIAVGLFFAVVGFVYYSH